MSMQRLIPLAAAALLGGCVTGYTYHHGNGGDYYYGDPRVEYRYITPGGAWYGYSPYPYGYWGGYYGGYHHRYYGGWYGYGPGYGYWGDPWYYYRGGPYKPRHPGHRPPPPPAVPPPGTVPNGGTAHVPNGTYGPPLGYGDDLERPGRRYGNPPPVERPNARRLTQPTGLPPMRPTTTTVRTPPPSTVQRPPPTYRPPSPPTYRPPTPPAPVPRTTVTPSNSDRAIERARTRSGAVDTP
jgi:hypothetical protein